MSYEHFGILLRELRESRNLTREQLANNICTPKQIYRIEKGECDPSLYVLNQLSVKFNMDLNEYFKMHFNNQSIIGFEGIKQINTAVEHNNFKILKNLVQKYEVLEEFKQGENFEYILYGKALCATLLEKDYISSLNYCILGVQIENPEFSIETIKKSIYSNVGLSLINCIGLNYLSMNQQKIGLKILYDLLYVIENFILKSPYSVYQINHFSNKIYENTLYNISLYLLNDGDVKKALHYVNRGITFSMKEYSLRFLPEFLYIKFKLLYHSKQYSEAQEYYHRVICLYQITSQNDKLKELEALVTTEYPEILIFF